MQYCHWKSVGARVLIFDIPLGAQPEDQILTKFWSIWTELSPFVDFEILPYNIILSCCPDLGVKRNSMVDIDIWHTVFKYKSICPWP